MTCGTVSIEDLFSCTNITGKCWTSSNTESDCSSSGSLLFVLFLNLI
jgi:hypothetical protein